MKQPVLTFTISLFMTLLFAQERTVNYKDIKIDGLNFITNKSDVIKRFGTPVKILKPDYECGFLSEGQPGGTYYSLQYPYIKFTGNTLNYQLEEVLFNPKMRSKVTYKNQALSHQTTTIEFEKIFGVKISENEVTIFHENADDALVFSFVGGLLFKITYWSPC